MPPGTGILHQTVGLDLIYSFVIIFVSLMIYFGTKELYELSNHKGIKYFRLAFLFFALAYAFRFLTQFLVLSLGMPRTFNTSLGAISAIALMLFMYASTAAIFYLWASGHWKWFNKKTYAPMILHLIALALAFFVIATQHILLLLVIQLVLVFTLAMTTYRRDKKKKGARQTYVIHLLLGVFWALSILDLIVPNALFQMQIIIYLLSISLFLFLLYKVIKKTGP